MWRFCSTPQHPRHKEVLAERRGGIFDCCGAARLPLSIQKIAEPAASDDVRTHAVNRADPPNLPADQCKAHKPVPDIEEFGTAAAREQQATLDDVKILPLTARTSTKVSLLEDACADNSPALSVVFSQVEAIASARTPKAQMPLVASKSIPQPLDKTSSCAPESPRSASLDTPCNQQSCIEVNVAVEEPPACNVAQGDWSIGVVRVLLTLGLCADDAGRQNQLDDAHRIEQWCRKCGVDDVSLVVTSSDRDPMRSSEDVKKAIQSLAARCTASDVCIVILVGLPASCTSPNTAGEGSTASPWREIPPRVTLVCMADSVSSMRLLGFDANTMVSLKADTLRVVLFLCSCHQEADVLASKPQRDVCTRALLRAADALSLADGPCSLSCADVLNEVGEQARDLAARAGWPSPRITLEAHPGDKLADAVRWPIAAKPRNEASPAREPTGGDSARDCRENPAAGLAVLGNPTRGDCRTFVARRVPAASAPPVHRGPEGRVRQSRSDVVREKRAKSHAPRALPTTAGELSVLLSGGGLADSARANSRPNPAAASLRKRQSGHKVAIGFGLAARAV